MSTTVTKKMQNAFVLLKKDHDLVKKLFTRFEKAKDFNEKKEIIEETLKELKVHATIEENLFYPAVRMNIDDTEIMEEADEEHHVAKVLIAEIEQMAGDEEHYGAKFTVLAENIRHHIKEEEGEMFSEARKTPIDFNILGSQMMELKQKLEEEGVPPDAEAIMVEKVGLRGDSPAMNASRTIEVPLKSKKSKN